MDAIKKGYAFTLCSNNYLAQANVLKESFLKFNPNFQFYIGLVDQISSDINYEVFEPSIIVPISKLKSINVDELIAKYDIVEFNTCVKPSFFKYIIEQNKDVEYIYYIDPDICFYNSIDPINTILQTHSIVLTPHITSAIKTDLFLPNEQLFLNYGLFNLGFLGINAKTNNAIKMLNWWEDKTLNLGFNNTKEGLFVDQLWMNYLPIYYNDVFILKSFNYNMAPWNLHERSIVEIKDNNQIILNDDTSLVFYHFSNLSSNRDEISRFYKRYNFQELPLLKKLYQKYFELIDMHGYFKFKEIPIHYVLYKQVLEEKKISFMKKKVLSLISILEKISRRL